MAAEGVEGCEGEGYEEQIDGAWGGDAGVCESGGDGEVGASGGGEGDCEGGGGEGGCAVCMLELPVFGARSDAP